MIEKDADRIVNQQPQPGKPGRFDLRNLIRLPAVRMMDIRYPGLFCRSDVKERLVSAREKNIILPKRRRKLPSDKMSELSRQPTPFEGTA